MKRPTPDPGYRGAGPGRLNRHTGEPEVGGQADKKDEAGFTREQFEEAIESMPQGTLAEVAAFHDSIQDQIEHPWASAPILFEAPPIVIDTYDRPRREKNWAKAPPRSKQKRDKRKKRRR